MRVYTQRGQYHSNVKVPYSYQSCPELLFLLHYLEQMPEIKVCLFDILFTLNSKGMNIEENKHILVYIISFLVIFESILCDSIYFGVEMLIVGWISVRMGIFLALAAAPKFRINALAAAWQLATCVAEPSRRFLNQLRCPAKTQDTDAKLQRIWTK